MNLRRTTLTTVAPLATSMIGTLIGTIIGTVATMGTALAHVSVEPAQAEAGATVKTALRVGHGCNGSATHTVRVLLPEGLRGAKPMPKAGWTLTLRRAPLAQPYDSHGRQVTEDVVEISWQATTREAWLDDAFYDEFVVRGTLPEREGPLWWRVTQLCERGRWDWTEVPASGTDTRGLRAPAALQQLAPADPHAGHAH